MCFVLHSLTKQLSVPLEVFISNGRMCDLVVVVTVTDREAKTAAHGISLFLVEDGMKGFQKGRKLDKIGLKAQVLTHYTHTAHTLLTHYTHTAYTHNSHTLLTHYSRTKLRTLLTRCSHTAHTLLTHTTHTHYSHT